MGAITPPSPVLFGPNNLSNSLQTGMVMSNGQLLEWNGQKNYIPNGSFENGTTTGWALGTTGTLTNGLPTGSPTFGSGASGNLSIGILNGGSQIAGNSSIFYSSTTTTTAGNMLATNTINIDTSDQGKVLGIRFYYSVSSGASFCNFSGTSSNSFAWAVYDVTNLSWLSSTGNFNLIQNSGVGYCTGTVQTAINTTQIAFVFYNANATTGNPVTLALDDFYVGPQTAPSGPAVSDWKAFTPTGTFTTNTTYTGFYNRVGDTAFIQYYLAFAGAPNSTTLTLNMPSGLVIDTTKLTNAGTNCVLGSGRGIRSGTFGYSIEPQFSTSTAISLVSLTTSSGTNPVNVGANTAITQAAPYTIASGDFIEVVVQVPIVGWSSNTSMSSDTDTRVVAAYGNLQTPTGTISSSQNVIKFGTVTKDTHAAYNTSTGLYTVPVTGWYQTDCFIQIAGTYSLNGNTYVVLQQNGSAVQQGGSFAGGANTSQTATLSCSVYCNAGDTLGFYSITSGSGPSYSAGNSQFSINRLSGPAVIAATESVNARATGATGTITSSASAVTFPTKSFDSHNALSGSTYTIPVSGKYSILSTVNVTYTTSAAVNNNINITQNGSAVSNVGGGLVNANTAACALTIADVISCNGGDTIQITVSSTASSPAVTNSTASHFAIYRVGN